MHRAERVLAFIQVPRTRAELLAFDGAEAMSTARNLKKRGLADYKQIGQNAYLWFAVASTTKSDMNSRDLGRELQAVWRRASGA